jgi:hypothetical protein
MELVLTGDVSVTGNEKDSEVPFPAASVASFLVVSVSLSFTNRLFQFFILEL